MNIYQETNYQVIIQEAVKELKKLDSTFHFQKLAEIAGIQKSYLSKVIHGTAHLNTDQLHMICEQLRMDEPQQKYMALLLEYAKSSLKQRKEKIFSEIQKIQTQFLETKKHLSKEKINPNTKEWMDYYLDPLNQIVHVCLSIERYQKDVNLLAQDLNIDSSKLISLIQTLERLGIITRYKNKIEVLIKELHLPKDSTLYASWRNQLKLLTLQRLQHNENGKSYSFSVVFSADPQTKNKIQAKFLELLKETEPWVQKAPSQETFQMNFDLFSWTKSA